ncbi:MAG: DUF2953 domain-containing protein [Oscillospiraceae bacterium]|nr:DUF2953 domain-containing protein [Oscillospiraceae bacterium]
MKILLSIFLFIICLLFFILFLPVKINFFYDSKLKSKYNIFVKILFLKINLNLNKQDKYQDKVIDKPDKNLENNKDDDLEKSISYYYNLIKQVYDIISPAVKKLLFYFKIKNIEFCHIVCGTDAATIGIKYGKINFAVYNIYNIINEVFNIKKSKIFIYPDFVDNNKKSQTQITIKIEFAPIYILLVIITLIMNLYFIKNKKNKKKL